MIIHSGVLWKGVWIISEIIRKNCELKKVYPTTFSFYRPQTKFAKVMFLHVSVSHSVHRGGMAGAGACVTGGVCGWGGGRACMASEVCMAGACVAVVGVHGRGVIGGMRGWGGACVAEGACMARGMCGWGWGLRGQGAACHTHTPPAT